MSLLTSTRLTYIAKDYIKDDIYALRFKPARLFSHTAGQHGFFMVPGTRKIKPFSLASAPEDGEVMIATQVRHTSSYKQALARLKPGDTVRLLGPVFRFVLRPHATDVVFLAQGIGITPFRSLLRHIEQAKLAVHTTLIHVEQSEPIFGDETKALADDATYPTSREAYSAQLQQTIGQHPAAVYYLSGSTDFIRSTNAQLTSAGIPYRRIKYDWFLGY